MVFVSVEKRRNEFGCAGAVFFFSTRPPPFPPPSSSPLRERGHTHIHARSGAKTPGRSRRVLSNASRRRRARCSGRRPGARAAGAQPDQSDGRSERAGGDVSVEGWGWQEAGAGASRFVFSFRWTHPPSHPLPPSPQRVMVGRAPAPRHPVPSLHPLLPGRPPGQGAAVFPGPRPRVPRLRLLPLLQAEDGGPQDGVPLCRHAPRAEAGGAQPREDLWPVPSKQVGPVPRLRSVQSRLALSLLPGRVQLFGRQLPAQAGGAAGHWAVGAGSAGVGFSVGGPLFDTLPAILLRPPTPPDSTRGCCCRGGGAGGGGAAAG